MTELYVPPQIARDPSGRSAELTANRRHGVIHRSEAIAGDD